MITDAQEAKIADARTRSAQDKANPLLINIDDGRLMPNVRRVLRHKSGKYVIYSGDPKASLENRMLWLQSMGRQPGARRIINTAIEEEVVDLGKLTKEDLVELAMVEYQTELPMNIDVKEMRKRVMALAAAHQQSHDNMKRVPSTEQLG